MIDAWNRGSGEGFAAPFSETADFITFEGTHLKGRILGCSLLCHAAGEMISTVQMVRQAQIPYTILRDGVLTHPTMTEGLNLLFSKL
jgi:pyruvate/2-oxoglutarate dehydrogenase complex dihydrolipoamide dehydrogenase (E3) component